MTINIEDIQDLKPFGVEIYLETAEVRNLKREYLLQLVKDYKIVLFRNLKNLDSKDLLGFCANDIKKELLHWDFGPVMEMKVNPDPNNYLFSRECVPFHWDGAFHTVPSFLVFNCIEAPTENCGGETIFCNTEMVWNDASVEQKNLWSSLELSYETEKKSHYGGKIQAPMVQKHPHTNNTILRYAEPVETELNPVTMQVVGNVNFETFIDEMKSLIYNSEKYCYTHKWLPGDLLLADNHSLIHGRHAFTQNCPRHLRRIQIL